MTNVSAFPAMVSRGTIEPGFADPVFWKAEILEFLPGKALTGLAVADANLALLPAGVFALLFDGFFLRIRGFRLVINLQQPLVYDQPFGLKLVHQGQIMGGDYD